MAEKKRRAPRKIDSAQYFESMASHYAEFIEECRKFGVQDYVTQKMDGMVLHIRRAALQIRKRRESTL